jgi:hypothetical protein
MAELCDVLDVPQPRLAGLAGDGVVPEPARAGLVLASGQLGGERPRGPAVIAVRERGAASPPTAQPTAPWAGRCSTTVSEEGMNTLS